MTTELIRKYDSFIEELDSNPFDFLPEKKEIEFDFIKPEGKKFLEVIASNKAGCLVCKFKIDKSGRECFAWLDSEGWPNAVFVETIEQFFSILPYSTGKIYEMISAVAKSKEEDKNLCNGFNDLSPDLPKPDILELYMQKMDIKVEKSPCNLIFRSYHQFQVDFKTILQLPGE